MTEFQARHFTARDGLRLYYRDYPGPRGSDKEPVLCLAGLTRNSKDFGEIAAHLAATRRVLAPDYRGRGLSAWDMTGESYHPPVYAGDALDLLAAAGVHQVVLLGTSLGGILGMVLGVMRPGVLKAVILNDIGPDLETEGLARIRGYVSQQPEFESWEQASAATSAAIPDIYPDFGEADWLGFARKTYRRFPDDVIRLDYDPAIARVFSAGDVKIDLWPYFRALAHVPLLSIRGELSLLFTARGEAAMKAERPDMATALVPRTGHVPILTEKPAITAIDRFLKAL